jgi:hypothetical protein
MSYWSKFLWTGFLHYSFCLLERHWFVARCHRLLLSSIPCSSLRCPLHGMISRPLFVKVTIMMQHRWHCCRRQRRDIGSNHSMVQFSTEIFAHALASRGECVETTLGTCVDLRNSNAFHANDMSSGNVISSNATLCPSFSCSSPVVTAWCYYWETTALSMWLTGCQIRRIPLSETLYTIPNNVGLSNSRSVLQAWNSRVCTDRNTLALPAMRRRILSVGPQQWLRSLNTRPTNGHVQVDWTLSSCPVTDLG